MKYLEDCGIFLFSSCTENRNIPQSSKIFQNIYYIFAPETENKIKYNNNKIIIYSEHAHAGASSHGVAGIETRKKKVNNHL